MKATETSRGRVRNEPADNFRNDFQRDTHRILYSQPFRRSKHKTQVFFLPKNDHICTRLEHSLYVAYAARTVATGLKLNTDLAEAIGLGHDLGHAPFGHHGENVLSEICVEHGLGEFHHELHGLRMVDKLAELDRSTHAGLNLTYEVRDGIVSHCGESKNWSCEPRSKTNDDLGDIDHFKNLKKILAPATYEGCIVRIIDRIAYAGRDLEDGLVAELVQQSQVPPVIDKVLGSNNGKIVGTLIEDIIATSQGKNEISLSEEKGNALNALIDFNYKNIYLHKAVQEFKDQATKGIRVLFERLNTDIKKSERFKDKGELTKLAVYNNFSKFIENVAYSESESNEQIVVDFISGMTDHYVIDCLNELFIPKGIV